MEGILYLDVFLLWNFLMNGMIAVCLMVLSRRKSSVLRVFLSALLVSILECVLLLCPMPGFLRGVFYYPGLGTLFVTLLWGKETWPQIGRHLGFLLLLTWIIGGIFLFFYTKTGEKVGISFGATGITMGILCGGILWKRGRAGFYPVKLFFQGEVFTGLGFVDTGNTLYEPGTGLPVILVEQGIFSEVTGEETDLYHISYHTVGIENGVLLGVRPKRCLIKEGGEWRDCKVILAFYNGSFCKNHGYRILLHPELVSGETKQRKRRGNYDRDSHQNRGRSTQPFGKQKSQRRNILYRGHRGTAGTLDSGRREDRIKTTGNGGREGCQETSGGTQPSLGGLHSKTF